MKKELKEKAIALRLTGLSYNEIMKLVPVSKGSLSLWLRDVPISDEARQRLADRKLTGALVGVAKISKRAKEKRTASERPEERLVGHTKWKGVVSETAFVAEAVRRRLMVSTPIGDNYPYDALVDTGDEILKVQVKTITFDKYDANSISARRTRYRDGRMVSGRYEDGDYDVLLGYCPERHKFVIIPWKEVPAAGNMTIRFDSVDKYTKYVDNWEPLTGPTPP